MFKKIIKYSLFCILPMNLLFAQESGLNRNYTDNNINVNKTEFSVNKNIIKKDISSSKDEPKYPVIKSNLYIYNKEIKRSFLEHLLGTRLSVNSHERSEKNIITSISDNIEVGSISGKFAEISFTPKLNIEPFDFISVSANQDVRSLIPIKNINEHLQLIFFKSAYIVAIDNFMNLLSKKQTMTQNIIGFVAKNLISSLVTRLIDNKIYSVTSYYYSIKIKL